MLKNILLKVLSVFLGLAIAFIVGEIMLREKRDFFSDHVMRYDTTTGLNTLYPNYQFHYKTECFDLTVRANSQGFNDQEFILEKPKDVFRIAVLGDSFVEGFQVPVEKSFHYLLQQKLNSLSVLSTNSGQAKKFEVYAFSMGGNGTFKNYLYLTQYALKYNPDLVILAFLPANDFGNDYGVAPDIVSSGVFDKEGNVKTSISKVERLLNKSALVNWLIYKSRLFKAYILDGLWARIFSAENASARVPFDFQVYLNDSPKDWDKVWDLEEKLLLEFKKTVEVNQASFAMFSINDEPRTYPELMTKDSQLSGILNQFSFDFNRPEKILKEFADSQNIPYLDLMKLFQEQIKKDKQLKVFFSCNAHWNEIGHSMVADALVNFLTQSQNGELLISKQ